MKTFEQSDRLNHLPEQFFAKLSSKVMEKVAAGHDIINLGQGNPDLPTPEHIVSRLQSAAENPVNHKYSPFKGMKYVREAAAAFYKREYGVDLDPDHEVALLFGGKAGLVELPQCLVNPGDVVLVPDPGYPDYWSGVSLAEAQMVMMPLLEKNQFLPDLNKIDEESAKKAKLMFLNYPNNPTGALADQSFFDEVIAFAEKYDICVVHDFAYGSIGFDGNRPVSYLQSERAKENGVEIYTLSKTFNMAGWRVAFAVGNPSVIKALNLLQDHLHVSLFGAVQEAAESALIESYEPALALSDTYEKRRNTMVQAFNEAGWQVEAPKGSFFAWFKVPKGYTSESFSDLLLEKAGVVVAPGIGFGESGEGYVRVALLADEERIEEAAARLSKLNIFNT
ncbi:pyridoxal phosphate-dependent aminotransferase [Jeotgalibacillus haloalkalitolerans]|uniref:Pyridoxal phosphate-dependent aminotransferase n=1 Tax=Jeotgalibacillus haloalkalitolerans TaxID=3104292 RepID=A0ABU5KNW0_9BACL|nr:pyridoxal phosphate-dependent aminotransferase [Jeotgalibacillus sp. HH7-29]MDZ5712943.1 pyridoxal phosphate-dependent aminotransferase [Jeotgalibacillus sp. HH7-29]